MSVYLGRGVVGGTCVVRPAQLHELPQRLRAACLNETQLGPARRQTDRQSKRGRQAGRPAGRQTDRQTERKGSPALWQWVVLLPLRILLLGRYA